MSMPGNGPFEASATAPPDPDRNQQPPAYSNYSYNNVGGASNPVTHQPAAQPKAPGYAPPPAYQYTNPGYPPPPRGQTVYTTIRPTVMVQQPYGPKPPDYMALAVVTACMCNILCGAIAVMFSLMSSNAWNRGDETAARSHGKTSLVLSIMGVVSGLGIVIFIVVYYTAIFSKAFSG